MRLLLIAVGERVPIWVAQGFEEYALRLRRPWTLTLTEIPSERRSRNADITRLIRAEGARLLAAVPRGFRIVALDSTGYQYNTETLAAYLSHWTDEDQNVAKAFNAACTPDAFLYSDAGHLFYRGQLDDSRPNSGTSATGKDLVNAIDLLNSGAAPPAQQLPSIGCNIKWKS